MINLKYASLHETIFLAGTNFGDKLDITKRADLLLQYDKEQQMLLVWYRGQLGMVPRETVAIMTPLNIADTGYTKPEILVDVQPPVQAAQPNRSINAQVSTPHDHVFANEPGLKVNR